MCGIKSFIHYYYPTHFHSVPSSMRLLIFIINLSFLTSPFLFLPSRRVTWMTRKNISSLIKVCVYVYKTSGYLQNIRKDFQHFLRFFIKINFIQLEAYQAHKYFYIIPFGNEIKCMQKDTKSSIQLKWPFLNEMEKCS